MSGQTPARLPDARDAVHVVRAFNRFYTRRIGVLQEHLLESTLSLTEVRLLYELAHRDGVTAAELCNDLGLDRGYVSRMVQRFIQRKWIKGSPSTTDRRRLHLSLTPKGRRVFAPLDRRSSDEVAGMLGALPPEKQGSLLAAMREIESLLNTRETAVPSVLRQPCPGDFGWVVQRHGALYAQEHGYDERFEALVAGIVAEFVDHFDRERERCWIAERHGENVGCVFLVRESKAVAKLRLLLVEPKARGAGLGLRLVSECIDFARQAGYSRMVLWTQSELHAARHVYERAGFARIDQKPHASWGRQDLVAETWELKL